MQRLSKTKNISAILISLILFSGCSAVSKSALSDINFSRADCISGISGGSGDDSSMYLKGYVEVSDIDIKQIKIEVKDSSTDADTWRAFEDDIYVDASGKANFSVNIVDYVKKHEKWNFSLRAVARESDPAAWKQYEFICPAYFMLNNLQRTK